MSKMEIGGLCVTGPETPALKARAAARHSATELAGQRPHRGSVDNAPGRTEARLGRAMGDDNEATWHLPTDGTLRGRSTQVAGGVNA